MFFWAWQVCSGLARLYCLLISRYLRNLLWTPGFTECLSNMSTGVHGDPNPILKLTNKYMANTWDWSHWGRSLPEMAVHRWKVPLHFEGHRIQRAHHCRHEQLGTWIAREIARETLVLQYATNSPHNSKDSNTSFWRKALLPSREAEADCPIVSQGASRTYIPDLNLPLRTCQTIISVTAFT